MEDARSTALFLILMLLVASWIVFKTLPRPPKDADDAVAQQGTNFKGRTATGIINILPPLSVPLPNWSANAYAGWTPKL
jgi:hypothetical protein